MCMCVLDNVNFILKAKKRALMTLFPVEDVVSICIYLLTFYKIKN